MLKIVHTAGAVSEASCPLYSRFLLIKQENEKRNEGNELISKWGSNGLTKRSVVLDECVLFFWELT